VNLIEQLGGYEAAKGLFNLYEYSISFKYYKVFKGDFESAGYIDVFIPDLQKALLEYRRQHNIFEVGDKVVSRCADKEIRIFTYQETIGRNILVKCKKGKSYCYPKKWFSHANDAEIKAGKRLGVNQ
jgi:hypothetical protein